MLCDKIFLILHLHFLSIVKISIMGISRFIQIMLLAFCLLAKGYVGVWAAGTENDSVRLAQFKQEVQPYLDTDNADYRALLQRYVGVLDSLARSGKTVKTKSLPGYVAKQPDALRQVVQGDASLCDTFLVCVQTALQQKYAGRKAKYWKKFAKVIDRAADDFVSEYADWAVADWESGGLVKRLRTPHGGKGPIIVDNDGPLLNYVPGGGSVVRRVLYRESEVNPKPQFPGGDKAYKAFLQRNVKYPAEAMRKKIQGAVRVGFTVKADGTVADVKVERKVSPLLDKEALRVVKSMPKWIPGQFEGKPVPVKMTVPVQFRLVTKKR